MSSNIIEVPIGQDMINQAQYIAKDLPSLRNSIERGGGNVAGVIGEVVAAAVLGATICNTYDYDIIAAGAKIDVKTKRCTSKPRPYYDCSVAAYNTRQRCDYYAFVRVLNDYTKAWYLGTIPKEEYFRRARKMTAGQIDPSNGFTVKADCYNLNIDEL